MRMLALPIKDVRPNKWNVNVLAEKDETALKQQMRVSGPEKTEPITVRKAPDDTWEIINGEQRYRIAEELGWSAIPAVEIEANNLEAKTLCLSYNAIRGNIDFAKLSKLLLEDEEMVEASRRVLGEETTKKLMESAKKLIPEAVEELKEAAREGAEVTPEKLEIVAKAPPSHQAFMAEAAKEETDEEYMKIVAEKFGISVGPSKEKAETVTAEEREEEKPEKPKAPKEKGEGKAPKAAELESVVEIAKPGTYLVYYSPEKKTVGIKSIKISGGFKTYEDVFREPKMYLLKLKCGCGRELAVKVDAETGEYERVGG